MKLLLVAILIMMPLAAVPQRSIVPQENNKTDEKIVPLSTSCMNLQGIDALLNEFDELPLIRGKSFRDDNFNSLIVFMNQETKSFTIVEKINDKKYCVISFGGDIEPVPQEIVDSIIKQRQRSRA